VIVASASAMVKDLMFISFLEIMKLQVQQVNCQWRPCDVVFRLLHFRCRYLKPVC